MELYFFYKLRTAIGVGKASDSIAWKVGASLHRDLYAFSQKSTSPLCNPLYKKIKRKNDQEYRREEKEEDCRTVSRKEKELMQLI